MTPISYLISVTNHLRDNLEPMLAIFNTAGMGRMIFGQSNDTDCTSVWVIPKGKKSKQEVETRFRDVPSILSFTITVLSKPISELELTEARKLFNNLDWDTSAVSDEELLLYLNDKVESRFLYYPEFEYPEPDSWDQQLKPLKVHIKRIEEHPDFSPDWLTTNGTMEEVAEDKEWTIDDFEVESGCFTETITETVLEIPPPPPPPDNSNPATDH